MRNSDAPLPGAGKESGKAALLIPGGKKILVADCDITTDAAEVFLGSLTISGSETEVKVRGCRLADEACNPGAPISPRRPKSRSRTAS